MVQTAWVLMTLVFYQHLPSPPAQGPAIMSAQPHEGSWLLWGSVMLEVSPMGWCLLRPLTTFDLQLF